MSRLTPPLMLGLALLAGCGSPQPTDPPTLRLTARVTSVTDQGDDTDLQVIALDGLGLPGAGRVSLWVEHGDFPASASGSGPGPDGGPGTITAVTLDSAGSAFTTYACDVHRDDRCFGPMRVWARWDTADASVSASRIITVTGCGLGDAGSPTIRRRCAPPTDDECAGGTDTFLHGAGVPDASLNDLGGNGFDDDCDGLVDEGCGCSGVGASRDCYLVPATQVDALSQLPVGWCAANARGSMSCQQIGDQQTWGVNDPDRPNCRGASPPREADICSPGDFDCDGLSMNAPFDCRKCTGGVLCPVNPVTLAPYPPPRALPLAIDGNAWIIPLVVDGGVDGGSTLVYPKATNWKWTLLGGDCDNVLPNPTFGLFSGPDTTSTGARLGARQTVAFDPVKGRYVSSSGSHQAAIVYSVAQGGGKVYPAFALSGDYVVQGEVDLGGTLHAVCTQKVQVRAPGVRAELCWDTAGTADLDLHMARLLGPGGAPLCTTRNGWDTDGCGEQDVYYADLHPNWSYDTTPDAGACVGWGSRGSAPCSNPRLDLDNISCTRATTDPNVGGFCGPENINLDNPRDGDRFVVGVNYFADHGSSGPPVTIPGAAPDGGPLTFKANHPHVNIYCNGARVLSSGYNPVSNQVDFPAMLLGGGDSTGDFWTVATITTFVDDGGVLQGCQVDPVPSRQADPHRDGTSLTATGTDFCVDSTLNFSTPSFSYATHLFVDDGGTQGLPVGSVPASPTQWCKH